jgi:ferritin-like metal-binding protein YciE
MLHNAEEIIKWEVQKLYSIENQLIDALKMLEGMAEGLELKAAFKEHRDQTVIHARRIEQICQAKNWQPIGIPSQTVLALQKDTLEALNGSEPDLTTDAMLIAAARKAEHLEIASYSVLQTMFGSIGDDASIALLTQNLEEEEEADKRLSEIAEVQVNRKAFLS